MLIYRYIIFKLNFFFVFPLMNTTQVVLFLKFVNILQINNIILLQNSTYSFIKLDGSSQIVIQFSSILLETLNIIKNQIIMLIFIEMYLDLSKPIEVVA